jgi:hypothetical protein
MVSVDRTVRALLSPACFFKCAIIKNEKKKEIITWGYISYNPAQTARGKDTPPACDPLRAMGGSHTDLGAGTLLLLHWLLRPCIAIVVDSTP